MLTIRGKRIHIEEPIASQGKSRENVVVEGSLQHIYVSGIPAGQEHALLPKDVRDGGTGFTIGDVARQFVVRSKTLPVPTVPQAAGQVQLPPHDVRPLSAHQIAKHRVALEPCQIGSRREEVQHGNCVPPGFVSRERRLSLGPTCVQASGVLDQRSREVKPGRLTRDFVEPKESQFHFRMPRQTQHFSPFMRAP